MRARPHDLLMATPTQTFLKIATRSKPRGGVSEARRSTAWQYYPEIVRSLARLPLFRPVISLNAFPISLSQYRSQRKLLPISLQGEFVWTASVLSLHVKKIQQFVILRDEFNASFLHGDYSKAERCLERLERDLGQSLWLISRKMQLLQLQHGLAAQKDYLEETIATPGVDTVAAWLAYYFSLRSEQNVSYSAFTAELSELIASGPPLSDFILHHLLPYDSVRIQDLASNFYWIETHPIVDRYEVFVASAQQYLARFGNESVEFLKISVDTLASLEDEQLEAVRQAVDPVPSLTPKVLRFFDYYAQGKYHESLEVGVGAIELVARSYAQLQRPQGKFQDGTVFDQIVAAIHEILSLGSRYQSAVLHLKKLSLVCAGGPLSIEIAAFVERTHDFIHSPQISELDKLSALKGSPGNPWNELALPRVASQIGLLRPTVACPMSTSLRLISALNQSLEAGSLTIDKTDTPEYRKALYKGHLAFKHGLFDLAAQWFRTTVGLSGEGFTAGRASSYLFRSIFQAGDVQAAVTIASAHCVQNVHAFRIYPLLDLISAALALKEMRGTIELAILIHLAARNVHPRWDRELSDVYERCLIKREVQRPSELLALNPKPDRLILYFLRNVCVPRVMDDSFEFESVEDIEDERILLCQRLSEVDPDGAEAYSTEIKTITREATIHNLLRQVESSKIYVDEEGIKAAVKDTLEPAFLRYQVLLRNPNLSYQAEKISRRIEQLLGDNITPDLRNLRLPASEQESLFNTMLTDFVEQFALNPAYGLDTHLSTTIRHGAFEGHMRSAFTSRDLLIRKDKTTQSQSLPVKWEMELSASPAAAAFALKVLLRFTESVEKVIGDFHANSLRVKTEANPRGFFVFLSTPAERVELFRSVTESSEYRELLSKFFAYCWLKTEESLASIRSALAGAVKNDLNMAIDRAVASITQSAHSAELEAITDSLVMGRTGLQSSIENICNWFHLPRDLAREPFELDLAIDVALKQVQNCYVKTSIGPVLRLNTPKKFREGALMELWKYSLSCCRT